MQSILWCAWPPSGKCATLEIVCGSDIDDIWGIPRQLLIVYIFRKFNYSLFFEILF